jgi:hypothetical protein
VAVASDIPPVGLIGAAIISIAVLAGAHVMVVYWIIVADPSDDQGQGHGPVVVVSNQPPH